MKSKYFYYITFERGLNMQQIFVKAFAKINLVLDVLKKREDGYHEVEMIMQAISLHDEVIIKPGKGIKVVTNHPLVPNGEKNLAYKAAQLLVNKYSVIPGVEIYIDKKIPIAAGLAGGSSNAAAVILGLNELFTLNMDMEEMLTISGQLGSDVPFCISGPTVLAWGRGELIKEISECPLLWVVLVKPEFGVQTADVYRNLNLKEIVKHPHISEYIKALNIKDVNYVINNLNNILEQSTFKLYPEVKKLKESLQLLGANHVLMSGSGPTVFALFKSREEALNFTRQAKKYYNQVYIAHTLSKQEINERVKLL
jgi:4-diphosphocytidyl-2-C-methyl-D-erythritol kinase